VDVEAIPLQVPQPPPALGVEGAPAPAPALTVPAPSEPIAQPAAGTAVTVPAAAPARPRNLPDIPPITLALPLESGLELVQTTARAPAPLEEPEPVSRPKRVRPPKPAMPDEPLQIVETRREDAPPQP